MLYDRRNSPSVVFVFRYKSASFVGYTDYVSLQILYEIIGLGSVVNTADIFLVIVDRSDYVASVYFPQNFRTVKNIAVLYSVYSFACSYPVRVVGITVRIERL